MKFVEHFSRQLRGGTPKKNALTAIYRHGFIFFFSPRSLIDFRILPLPSSSCIGVDARHFSL